MLDDDDRIASLGQSLEHVQQHGDVLRMQSRGRLVEDVQSASGLLARELGGQLDPLVLSAAESQRGLPQTDVAQPHVLKGLELAGYGRHGGEELHSLGDGHLQHVVDALSFVFDRKDIGIEPLAVTLLASDRNRWQEVHLYDLHPGSLAGLAATALDVEGKLVGLESAYLCIGSLGEQAAYGREHTGVGGRVGARGASHRRLVYLHELVYVVQPFQRSVRQHIVFGAVEPVADYRHEGVVDKRRLAAAADSAYTHDTAQRYAYIDILQVVARSTLQLYELAVAGSAVCRNSYLPRAFQILEGVSALAFPVYDGKIFRQSVCRLQFELRRSGEQHLSSFLSCARSDIHYPVRVAHHLLVMFHDHDRVALVAQPFEGVDKLYVVALVQADTGLVQDIQHIDQLRADLGGQSDALALAAAERHGAAAQREIGQTDIHQEAYPFPEFLDDISRHRLPSRIKLVLQTAHPVVQYVHIHVGDLGDIEAAYLETQRFFSKTLAVTFRAYGIGGVSAGHGIVFILPVPVQPGEQSRESHHLGQPSVGVYPYEILRTVEDDIHIFLRYVLYRLIQGESVFAGHRFQDCEYGIVAFLAQRSDASVGD